MITHQQILAAARQMESSDVDIKFELDLADPMLRRMTHKQYKESHRWRRIVHRYLHGEVNKNRVAIERAEQEAMTYGHSATHIWFNEAAEINKIMMEHICHEDLFPAPPPYATHPKRSDRLQNAAAQVGGGQHRPAGLHTSLTPPVQAYLQKAGEAQPTPARGGHKFRAQTPLYYVNTAGQLVCFEGESQ